ncbi:MAG: hypothetical protein WB460_18505, partial [Candidatus Acidiferrales bacterium]
GFHEPQVLVVAVGRLDRTKEQCGPPKTLQIYDYYALNQGENEEHEQIRWHYIFNPTADAPLCFQ